MFPGKAGDRILGCVGYNVRVAFIRMAKVQRPENNELHSLLLSTHAGSPRTGSYKTIFRNRSGCGCSHFSTRAYIDLDCRNVI